MIKSHFALLPHTVVNYLVDSKTYLVCLVGFATYALVMLYHAQFMNAFIASFTCGSLLLTRYRMHWCHYTLPAIAIAGILGALTGSSLGWLVVCASPLIFFFVASVRWAGVIVSCISLFVLLLLALKTPELKDGQIMLNYLLCLGISILYVYLRETKQRELRPLRRTDQLTTAAASEYLYEDLTKEIQRSEREGSALSVFALGIDKTILNTLDDNELNTVIVSIGRLLHNNLRVFDSYYRWDHDQYFIVLPHTSSDQAQKIANHLRVKIRAEIQVSQESISVSAGIAGLNVGDSAESLTSKASKTLANIQNDAKNMSAVFEADTHTDDPVE